jgi:hypothetical protein
MKFDWTNFTEVDFVNYCAKAENGAMAPDDYVGCVRVGDLCFDLLARMDDNCEKWHLSYDLYVGGVDTGYGYSDRNSEFKNYPYDYAEGGDFEDGLIWMTYEEFQQYAEQEFEKFILTWQYDGASLVEKANEPLKMW